MLYLVRVWLRYNYSVCVVVGVCVSGLTFVRFGELTVLTTVVCGVCVMGAGVCVALPLASAR